MGVLRQQRLLIAWIAIIGLMMNLAAAALCCVPAKAAVSDQSPEFVLCLHEGAEAPHADESAPPQPAVKPCPLCVATAVSALIVLALVSVGLIVVTRAHHSAFSFISIARNELRRAGLACRAPPLPV
jgi:DUF2946 family protein